MTVPHFCTGRGQETAGGAGGERRGRCGGEEGGGRQACCRGRVERGAVRGGGGAGGGEGRGLGWHPQYFQPSSKTNSCLFFYVYLHLQIA